jgi:diguanylate cyclase (GGDEF)-like protein
MKIESKKVLEDMYEDSSDSPMLCFSFIDINGLKIVNDTRGHAAGDRCIEALEESLITILDLEFQLYRVFKVGGDEYVVMHHSDGEKDSKHFSKLYKSIESLFVHKINNYFCMTGIGLSVGVVRANRYANFKEAVNAADMLMYESKLSSEVVYRADKVSPETIRKRDPIAVFKRDVVGASLKLLASGDFDNSDVEDIIMYMFSLKKEEKYD